MWAEPRRRCNEAGVSLTIGDQRLRGVHGEAVVGVTPWGDLLTDIDRHLVPVEDHRRTIAEFEQLRGLCERADRDVFQPFTAEFLGGGTGRQLLDLDALINEVVASLGDWGLASTAGLRWRSGQGWYGRYLRIAGWESQLHVSFHRWGTQRGTPLWLQIADQRSTGNAVRRRTRSSRCGTRIG